MTILQIKPPERRSLFPGSLPFGALEPWHHQLALELTSERRWNAAPFRFQVLACVRGPLPVDAFAEASLREYRRASDHHVQSQTRR